ncbi:MAG: hypothetical protein ABL962_12935 [Fimbriimonadaceae bacterium]
MSTKHTLRIAGIVGAHLFALALALVPVIADHELHEKGPEPSRHLSLFEHSFNQPLIDLRPIGSDELVSLTIGKRQFTNLFIVNLTVTNTGAAPILPGDFHSPFSISVPVPWEIVTVKNGKHDGQQVILDWQSVSATKFTANPALVNPNDVIASVVYLSNPTLPPLTNVEESKKPTLQFDARITNLISVERRNNHILALIESVFDAFGGGFYSLLTGKAMVCAFVFGMINLGALLFLLGRAQIVKGVGCKLIMWTIIAAALSAATAECLVSYIFGDVIANLMRAFDPIYGHQPSGTSWFNAPALLIDATVIIVLLNWRWLKSKWKTISSDMAPIEAA